MPQAWWEKAQLETREWGRHQSVTPFRLSARIRGRIFRSREASARRRALGRRARRAARAPYCNIAIVAGNRQLSAASSRVMADLAHRRPECGRWGLDDGVLDVARALLVIYMAIDCRWRIEPRETGARLHVRCVVGRIRWEEGAGKEQVARVRGGGGEDGRQRARTRA
jgi:hypothetical protein